LAKPSGIKSFTIIFCPVLASPFSIWKQLTVGQNDVAESRIELRTMPKKRLPFSKALLLGILAILSGCLCGLSVTLRAQTTLQTFTSQDGVFQFKYFPVLVHCTSQKGEEGYAGSWVPADACSSQDGVCDDAGSSATTIACFAYPKDDCKDKPEFIAAAFFVAEVRAATNPKSCLKGSQNWLIRTDQSAMVSSILARRFRISDAWMSGGQTGEIYRVFHGKKCYEFGIQEASSSPGAYDPKAIKQFTKRDSAKVRARLEQARDSFTFLKSPPPAGEGVAAY